MICFWNRVCMKIIEYIVHCSHQDMLKTAAETGGLPPDRTCTLRWDQRWHTNKDDALLFPSLSMKSTIPTELWLRLQCLNASAWFRWFQTSSIFVAQELSTLALPSYLSSSSLQDILESSLVEAGHSSWQLWSSPQRWDSQLVVGEWLHASQEYVKSQQLIPSLYLQSQTKGIQRVLGVRVTAATTATRFRPKHCVPVNLSESIEGWPQHEDSINFFRQMVGLIVRLWSLEWSRSSQLWTIQCISHVTFSCKDQGF